jgi:hypothetical protein
MILFLYIVKYHLAYQLLQINMTFKQYAVLLFTVQWSDSCDQFRPHFQVIEQEFKQQYPDKQFQFKEYDIHQNLYLPAQYKIESFPTCVLVLDEQDLSVAPGKYTQTEVDRLVCFDADKTKESNKLKEKITQFVENY